MSALKKNCLGWLLGFLIGLTGTTRALGAEVAATPFFQLPESSITGGKLFMEKGCIHCHSIQGLGGIGGPDLGKVRAVWSFLDIAGVMWNHLPKMEEEFKRRKIKRPKLKNDEAYQLLAFVYFLNYFGNPGDAAKGELVFLRKNCIACHRVGPHGPRDGNPLDRFQNYRAPAFISAAFWSASKEMTRAMQDRELPRPVYEANDIVDILAFIRRDADLELETQPVYLAPGSARKGATVFREKGCIQCHAVRGQGGQVGPALGVWETGGVLSRMAGAIWNHGPNMWAAMEAAGISYPSFSAEEMSDLMTYLYFSSFADGPGDPVRGARLFSEKGCGACHESQASAAPRTALPVAKMKMADAAEVIATMWNHAPEMEEVARTLNMPWPRVKPGEMVDLVAFIRAQGLAEPKP